ncbi:hypothetical protein C4E22_06380 [ANME-1 cluster archaeon AG-394-G06]|nr:hypothetical protein [ANME-1 cluster archaeon AG-394-G06]
MAKRKVIVELEFDDDSVNSIEDLEREILAQDIYGQVARKYLDSLQDDMMGLVDERKGSKKVHIKTPHFEFDFQAKRTLDETGKKGS